MGLTLGIGAVAVATNSSGRPAGHRPSVTEFNLPGDAAPTLAIAASANVPQTEPSSAAAAVTAFLTAEVADRPADAFVLLDTASHADFVSPAGWQSKRAERLVPTGFRIEGTSASSGSTEVVVAMEHTATLDPFIGLVPARSTQVVRVVQESGRWRVTATPARIEPSYPSDSGAAPAVAEWVEALSNCDRATATTLQVPVGLVGSPFYADQPCREQGLWRSGPVEPATGARLGPLFASYGAEVATWARLVRVDGPKTDFYAAVAPIGDAWRVMGVLAADGP